MADTGVPMSIDANKRIEWLDTLKLIGIFYIYLGHLGKDAGKLYPFVFSFHVPLFFFISGLFFQIPGGYKEAINKIKKSFIKIIMPYLIFSLIGIIIYTIKWDYSSARIIEALINVLSGIRNKVPLASLWFLPCLFVIIVFYCLISIKIKNPATIFLISLLIYCLTPYWFNRMPIHIFNVDFALNYMAFFSFGVLLSKKIRFDWPSFYEGSKRNLITLIIILSLLYFLYSYQNGTFTILKNLHVKPIKYFFIFIITCLMFIPSIAIAYWVDVAALKKLGRNTLVLCGTEQALKVVILSGFSLLGYTPQFKDPLNAIIFTIFCLSVSYFTVIKVYESLKFSKYNQ